jgi:fumarate hydratase, class I
VERILNSDLTEQLCELIRVTSTDLPRPVEMKLRKALENELPGSAAHSALETILANVELTRKNSTPICQDTGTPLFFVRFPRGMSTKDLSSQIRKAVELATISALLRPNAVDPISGENSGNNLGDEHFPFIHFVEVEGETLSIDLILKGGGCENVGAQYSLPDERLNAGRDLEGVRKVVLDAVVKAQGEGCAPGFLGVAIGGDRATSYAASKEVFLRDLDELNPDPELRKLEDQLTSESNQLGIGPMGFGGKSTVLGTQIASSHRLPASYFVSVSYMCWAFRHRRMTITPDKVTIE